MCSGFGPSVALAVIRAELRRSRDAPPALARPEDHVQVEVRPLQRPEQLGRRRDSNPWYRYPYGRFQRRCLEAPSESVELEPRHGGGASDAGGFERRLS